MNEDAIFNEALQKPTPADRAAFLDQACAGDPELRRSVDRLLQAHEQAGSFLQGTADIGRMLDEPIPEGPGTVVGPYKLLQQIGEGGMGTVFMAEQTQPVQRKVALKVIKAGMDSRQVIARFEAERQALALMDHPNIAKVLEAGTTDSGRPYFVMELVKGVPITRYCDEHHLSPRERLELFIPVCQAVQHAHHKGIVHRDLKPSNVLIALYDGQPVPKVIDFGVARAAGPRLTERTLFTQFGAVVGTLEYMSPEQAELNQLDIDTRSDIYALGVLLYELLTGTTPLERKQVKAVALLEVLRLIREEEAPRPSTRLSTTEDSPSIATNRGLEAKQLSGLVRGELDWIVLKALEKDRNRRYETANGFAGDVQRYLNDEPVQACPPSAGYRLRKFVRRNKGPVGASLVVAALLVLGTVGTSIGFVWALRAERLATDRLVEVTKEKERATAAETQAKEEAAIAQAINDFLQNDLLAEAAPKKNARAKKVTVEEVLGRAAARIAGKFEQQPQIEAAIRQTIGDTYRALGDYPAAQPHLERAWEIRRRILGEEQADTLVSMNSLAILYRAQGRFPKAEPLFVKALKVRRRVLGEEHPNTLTAMNNLASLYQVQDQFAKAEPLFVKALEVRRRVLGEEHHNTLRSMNNLAVVYQALTNFPKAEPLYIKALEVRRRVLGEEHPDTLQSMNNLASLYQAQGQFGKAEPLLVQALEVGRRVLGGEHPDTLQPMNNLASLYQAQGQFPKAQPLFVKALEVRRRVLGEEHPDTLRSMNNLASLYQAQGQFPKAQSLYDKALEIRRRVLGEEHADTLVSMSDLAGLYQAQGQYAEAEPLFSKALEISRRVLGDEHPDTLTYMTNLAALSWFTNKLERSVPLFEEALKSYQARSGPDHPNTLRTMANLGVNYRDTGHLPEGTALLEQAWEKAQKQPQPLAESLTWIPSALALTYEQAGQFAKSEPLYHQALVDARKRGGEASLRTAGVLASLGLNLLKQQKHAEGESLLRECLKIREQKEPDAWTTFNAKSMLGASLLGQKNYPESEPLLLAGYEGMKQREEKIPPPLKDRLAEAIERLVQLYEATGRKENAAEWRRKLSVTKPAKPTDTKKD